MLLQNVFFVIGTVQVVLIILVLLLLFGAKKIPDLMKGIGGGIKEFKNASADEIEEGKHEQHKKE